MRLMFTSFLDIPFPPQMQLLFLSPRYLSFCFQILKHDHIRVVFFRISCNCPCDLPSEFCVKTLRVSPSAFHLYRTMFPLEPAYPSQHTVHPVFFTGKINKFSSQDSSISVSYTHLDVYKRQRWCMERFLDCGSANRRGILAYQQEGYRGIIPWYPSFFIFSLDIYPHGVYITSIVNIPLYGMRFRNAIGILAARWESSHIWYNKSRTKGSLLMDHNNFNASSSTKTEEIIKEQAAAQEKSCCSNDNATPSAPACCCTCLLYTSYRITPSNSASLTSLTLPS